MAREVESTSEDRFQWRAQVRAPVSLVSVLIAGLIVLGPGAQVARAELVATEAVLDAAEVGSRARVASALAREDVRSTLARYGVTPEEAHARVDALTDREASQLAQQIDELPAGASAVVTVAIVGVIGFMALLTSDALGYTDLFPWVSKTPGR